MEKTYKPQIVENIIYQKWEKGGYFSGQLRSEKLIKKPFCIIMPPPNANAKLHIGHAMFITIEDILIRFHRMKQYQTLWLPGADHAGILTQVVFERHLEKQGKTRHSLERREFYQQCFAFTQKNKKVMYNQMRRMGASCDWSREKFTLDKDVSLIVLQTFVRLHQEGLIYRDWRMINWCTRCMTALSDLEVEWVERKDPLYFMKYGLFTLATTRPETMFGDVAVAVNPQDKRYKTLLGTSITLPLVNKKIPIIADHAVDPKFGTGVIKVTPAHDFTDFEIGKRHHLEARRVIEFAGKLNEKAGRYAGLSVKKARKAVFEDLNKAGLIEKIKENYLHKVARCERCKTIIEPMVSLQWFIDMNQELRIKNKELRKRLGVKQASLAKLGILAVKKKLIKIIPQRFEKIYFQWMENIEDWCISRQIWWGHRMPVWYCGNKGLSDLQKSMNPDLIVGRKEGCGETIVQLTKPSKCSKCSNTDIIQDPDTLDTWFSSAQWPYTTLGFKWDGNHRKDYLFFYPTSVMETGYEILFFWVARMIMLGLYSTGQVPFPTVYLHGLVRDAFGEKMSKSKGNVIDPLDVIDKYGADALRMALVWGIAPGSDSNIGDEKIRGMRNFANKLWNIGRFMLRYFDQLEEMGMNKDLVPVFNSKLPGLTKDDRQIIKKLNQTIHISTDGLQSYRLANVAQSIYDFTWHQLADRYIEKAKVKMQKAKMTGNKQAMLTTLSLLRHTYINVLKLLHPFMPFVTEELWSKIPGVSEQPLITASWLNNVNNK